MDGDFILIHNVTNMIVFRGNLDLLRKTYSWNPFMATFFSAGAVKQYAAGMNCKVYQEVKD